MPRLIVICPVCERRVLINADNRLRKHDGMTDRPCLGSGRFAYPRVPVERSIEEWLTDIQAEVDALRLKVDTFETGLGLLRQRVGAHASVPEAPTDMERRLSAAEMEIVYLRGVLTELTRKP
jgi:hypothetical protein